MPFIMLKNVEAMMMLVLQQETVMSMVPSARTSIGINSVPIHAMVATPVPETRSQYILSVSDFDWGICSRLGDLL